MSVKKVKAAIVGCGVISDIYIQSLQNKFQIIDVAACSDLNTERMKAQAEKYQIRAMEYDEILRDDSIGMILNLTNPGAHYSVTKQALEHGKHVFTEKMLAVELEEGKELCRMAKEKNLRLGVAPDTFLGGGIQTARYIVDKGLIGEPLSAMVSLNRNFDVFADLFPHMNQRGGTMPFDTGCYYMTALANVLGPTQKVTGFGRCYQPDRIGKRIDRPWFGKEMKVADFNIVTAVAEYANGVLCTVHFNSESILTERPCLEIYGTEGILVMGDPNQFNGRNYIQKPMGELIEFPFTHGYTENSRGVGAAEMAWSIEKGRPHRASMEMAYHVFELIHGMYISAESSQVYQLESTFDRPQALPTGYLDNGFWGPMEESALFL